jgi:hypothetical protein
MFPKIVSLMTMLKNIVNSDRPQTTLQNGAEKMRFSCRKNKINIKILHNYCSFIAIMFRRRRLHIALQAHGLSCIFETFIHHKIVCDFDSNYDSIRKKKSSNLYFNRQPTKRRKNIITVNKIYFKR